MRAASRPRPVVTVLVALLMAGVGAVLGAPFHWFVIEPSDGELLEAAERIELTGFTSATGPGLDGWFAPTLTRATVHWNATSEEPLDADRVADELAAVGWTVTGAEKVNASVTVRAVDGRTVTSVLLKPERDGGTSASIGVSRHSLAPTLGVCVLVGALVGAVGGLLLGWFGLRRRDVVWTAS